MTGRPAAPTSNWRRSSAKGPAVGVHALVWCDSYSNASRWLDRQIAPRFRTAGAAANERVRFEPAHGQPRREQAGTHLAFYYSEELGRAEKFRPYAVPSASGWPGSSSSWRETPAHPTRPDPTLVN